MSPMYNFTCNVCGEQEEHVVSLDERGEPIDHECGGQLIRNAVQPAKVVDKTAYGGMQGIVYQGEKKVGHVKGHFNREAKRKRKS